MAPRSTRRYRSRRPRRVARRRVARRRLISKRKPSTEYASLKETITDTVTANTINYYNGFALGDAALVRAPRVAANYQYFKLTMIEMKILTAFDTYPGGGAVRMPQVYWMINKGESIPGGLGFNQLLQLGAKPHVLNERNNSFRFKPAVNIAAQEGGPAVVNGSMIRVSPWLETNSNAGAAWAPSNTFHGGVILGVLPMAPGDATQYQVQITYHFKFKKPLVLVYEGQTIEGIVVDKSRVPKLST